MHVLQLVYSSIHVVLYIDLLVLEASKALNSGYAQLYLEKVQVFDESGRVFVWLSSFGRAESLLLHCRLLLPLPTIYQDCVHIFKRLCCLVLAKAWSCLVFPTTPVCTCVNCVVSFL